MNLLFVCIHNRFRSKVSEALFKKYNLNPKIKVKSAGIFLDPLRPYIATSVKQILLEKNLPIQNEQATPCDEFLIDWADKIILVASNANPSIFPKEKLEVWKIDDASESDIPAIKKIIRQIEKKVKMLIKSF
jgi:protein-tyrosine-phosphatase